MERIDNFFEINKKSWNNRVDTHLDSEFYDVPGFLQGKSSLKEIELELLGDIKGKDLLHLQCHFGQDTLSLARLQASVTGVDLSDKAIEKAKWLSEQAQIDASFICCNLYDLPQKLDKKFDIIFTSYGTIGWLPDLDKWAGVIAGFLKPQGKLILVEFHPVVWMFDDNFKKIQYSYFNTGAIYETEEGTYADRKASISQDYVMWNHSISDILNSLMHHQIEIQAFNEYDYSPYNCFNETEEYEPGKFRIKPLGNKIPLVFSVVGIRK